MTPNAEELHRILARLGVLLIQSGAPVAQQLRPGISAGEIDDLTRPLGIDLPYEARVLYQWHDGAVGAASASAAPLMGPWAFPPLHDQVEWYAGSWRAWRDEVFQDLGYDDPHDVWRNRFPVLRSADDQSAAMIEYPDRSGVARSVAVWDLWDPAPPAEALRQLSLLSLVETWVGWLVSRAIVWDDATNVWKPGREPLHWTTYRMGFV